jgi:pimeloyl-ACP methyl ester carboxylesterase
VGRRPDRGAAALAKAGPVDYRRSVCGLEHGGPMRSLLLQIALLSGLLLPSGAEARRMGVYDYPFVSALAATVAATPPANQTTLLGAAQIAEHRESRYLDVFPDRKTPPVFWYLDRGMPYEVLKQNRPRAPLFFVIGGTGAGADSVKSQMMANVLFQAGFHVVTVASPTHPSFIVTASSSGVPGYLEDDAHDLYRVMDLIADDLADEIGITDFYVGGYSLGGTHTAYVSYIDAQEKRFDFRRAVIINPAVSLYNSVNILDSMVDKHLRDDPDAVDRFLDHIFDQVIALYNVKDQIDFTDPAFLYRAYTFLEPPERELELLIGVVFRLTSSDMAFTSDVMTNAAYVVPKNARLTATTSLTDVMIQGMRLNFVNYFDDVYVPFRQARAPGITRQQLIDQASLYPIEHHLRTDPRVVLLGTADDVILSRGEVAWLEDVFGDRSRIFPTGGHCGSMDQREFVHTMLELIFAPGARS